MAVIRCFSCEEWFRNDLLGPMDLANFKPPKATKKDGAKQDGLGAFRCPHCGKWNHVYKDQSVPKDAVNPAEINWRRKK